MRSINTPLLNLLTTQRQFVVVDLYTITLRDGTVIRWTSADVTVTDGARSFYVGPVISRGETHCEIGLSPDTLDITFTADDNVTVSGMPLLAAFVSGMMLKATIAVEVGFAPDYGQALTGTVVLFDGLLADVNEVNSTSAVVSCKSHTHLLDTNLPLNVYQPGCLRTLYDAGCGVNKPSFSTSGTVGSGSTQSTLQTGLAQPAGWFKLGELVMLSGQNAGLRRSVKEYASGQFVLSYPLPNQPVVGDAFQVSAGCDKTMATCQTKFNNLAKFRGQPFVPQAETAL